MTDNIDKLLNPEVKEIKIGVKKIISIPVYPLTYLDNKIIGEKVLAFIVETDADTNDKTEDKTDIEYIGKLAQILESNLPLLITKCTDLDEEAFMKDITSGQIMDFITIIIEVNFLNPIMKGTKLFANMGSMYGVSQSLPPSVSNMDTNL